MSINYFVYLSIINILSLSLLEHEISEHFVLEEVLVAALAPVSLPFCQPMLLVLHSMLAHLHQVKLREFLPLLQLLQGVRVLLRGS